MNKTFVESPSDLSAAVGNNGYYYIDQDSNSEKIHEYVDKGFGKYSLGYDSVTKLILSKIDSELLADLDLIVYPLIYSARHRVELFIKSQILKLNYIKFGLIQKKEPNFVYKTHEISKLMQKLEELSKFDYRILQYFESIKEYAYDFSEIDDTGEVFRYPYSNDGIRHLIEKDVLNLIVFKARYLEFSDLMLDFDLFIDSLISEFRQGTFVGEKLSREMLKSIANELPQFNTWKTNVEEFNNAKSEIKKRYNIESNRVLSNVIDIIKKHYEFSFIIGIDNSLKYLSTEELNVYFNYYDDFLERNKTESKLDLINEFKDKLINAISPDAIFTLCQLYDVGYFRQFPEEFNIGYEIKKKENDLENCIRSFLFWNGIAKEKIIVGLKTLNQYKLLKSIGVTL